MKQNLIKIITVYVVDNAPLPNILKKIINELLAVLHPINSTDIVLITNVYNFTHPNRLPKTSSIESIYKRVSLFCRSRFLC